MAKVILERDGCIGCENCAAVCPALFLMAQDGKATLKGAKEKKKGLFERDTDGLKAAKEAERSCPVNVIHVKK